jgi:hypothetical protein
MADATLWATAGETAFGWESGTFRAIYGRNLDEGAVASVESHPVGVALMALLESEPDWTGTAGDLLNALKGAASDDQKSDPKWPKNARALGHALRRLAQAMRRAGIKYERGRDSRRRVLTLCKEGRTSSQTSQTERTRPPNVDHDNDDVLSPTLHEEEEALL